MLDAIWKIKENTLEAYFILLLREKEILFYWLFIDLILSHCVFICPEQTLKKVGKMFLIKLKKIS